MVGSLLLLLFSPLSSISIFSGPSYTSTTNLPSSPAFTSSGMSHSQMLRSQTLLFLLGFTSLSFSFSSFVSFSGFALLPPPRLRLHHLLVHHCCHHLHYQVHPRHITEDLDIMSLKCKYFFQRKLYSQTC